jgi:hypothetical protein
VYFFSTKKRGESFTSPIIRYFITFHGVDTFGAIAANFHEDDGDATAPKTSKDFAVATDVDARGDSADATVAKAYKGAVDAIVASYREDCADATVPKA